MTRTFAPFARQFAVLAACLATAAGASAQQHLHGSVDVHGKVAPRTTLQAACPQALDELPDALARTAQDVGEPGLVTVRFDIDGGRLIALKAEGGVGPQARAVKRAVRALGCSNGDAGRQSVAFQVRFVDPMAARDRGAVALLDLPR